MSKKIDENIREDISEIFSGIQGEGKYMGCRQIFVRFCGCNLNCRYCDTPHAVTPSCRVQTEAGANRFVTLISPVSLRDTVGMIRRFTDGSALYQAVAFTGGEPLLHAEFIAALSPKIHEIGSKVLLETNGTLPEQLAKVIDDIDIISMDIKLPGDILPSGSSNCDGSQKNFWAEHEKFINIAKQKDLYIKIVVSQDTEESEFREALTLIRGNAPDSMVILQPVTPVGECAPPSPKSMIRWQAYARDFVDDVRVIPQVHRMMGQL